MPCGVSTNTATCFFQLAYTFALVECFETYEFFFSVLNAIPSALFGFEGAALNVRWGGLGRCKYIADAYIAVWVGIILLRCWAHIARKVIEGHFRKKLRSIVSPRPVRCLVHIGLTLPSRSHTGQFSSHRPTHSVVARLQVRPAVSICSFCRIGLLERRSRRGCFRHLFRVNLRRLALGSLVCERSA